MTRAVAIDIGGTSTKVAAVSSDGAVHDLWTHATTSGAIDELTAPIAGRIRGAAGIGVAVAGFVNARRTAMIYNPNLAWLQGFPLRDSLEQRFGVPVTVDADSNAACLAEYTFGAGRGARRFLCLTLGTGVGGGMIVKGRIVRLAHGGLGDIGHVIVDPFGPPCGSGCRGCAEAVISASGIEARDGRSRSVRQIIEAAKAGDERSREVLAEAGRFLGVALASQAVIVFPDTIAIAGGIAEAGDLLIGPARQSFQTATGPFYRAGVRIEKSALGGRATLVGAAVPLLR